MLVEYICTFWKSKWEFKFTETKMQILCTELGGIGILVNGINADKLFHQLASLILFVVQLATARKNAKKISEKFTSTLEWNSFFACFVFVHFCFPLNFVAVLWFWKQGVNKQQNTTFICQQNVNSFGLTECYRWKKTLWQKPWVIWVVATAWT